MGTAAVVGGSFVAKAGLDYLGGRAQGKAAEKAAKQQAAAAREAVAEQRAAREQFERLAEQGITELRGTSESAQERAELGAQQAIDLSGRGFSTAHGATKEGFDKGLAAFNENVGMARGRLDPFAQLGGEGAGILRDLAAGRLDLSADDSYKFRLQQGEEALGRRAAASGGRLSGARLKSAQEFGQGLASQEASNIFARRANIGSQFLQSGQQATNMLAGIDTDVASSLFNANRQLGTQLGNLSLGRAQTEAGLRQGLQDRLGNIDLSLGQNIANTYTGVGASGLQSAQGVSNTLLQGGQNQANLALAQGQNQANMFSNFGNALQGAAGNYLFAQQAGLFNDPVPPQGV